MLSLDGDGGQAQWLSGPVPLVPPLPRACNPPRQQALPSGSRKLGRWTPPAPVCGMSPLRRGNRSMSGQIGGVPEAGR